MAEEANCVRYAGEKWKMKLSRQENMSRVVTFFMMAHPSMINDLHVVFARRDYPSFLFIVVCWPTVDRWQTTDHEASGRQLINLVLLLSLQTLVCRL